MQPQPHAHAQPQPQRTARLPGRVARQGQHHLPASPPQVPPPQLGGAHYARGVVSASASLPPPPSRSAVLTPGTAEREIDAIEEAMMAQMNPFRVKGAAVASAAPPNPLTPAQQQQQRQQQEQRQRQQQEQRQPQQQRRFDAAAAAPREYARDAFAHKQAAPHFASPGAHGAPVQLLAPFSPEEGGSGEEDDYANAERELMSLHSSIYASSPPPAAPAPAPSATPFPPSALHFRQSAPASPPGGASRQSKPRQPQRSAAVNRLGSTPLGVQRAHHFGR